MNIEKLFHDRSSRGEVRGADQVWEAAAAEGGSARRRRRVAWAAPLVAGAAVAAIVVPGWLMADSNDSGRDPDGPSTGDKTSTKRPSPTPSPITLADLAVTLELTDRYQRCALDAGFDPQGVQVLINGENRPIGVKTGRDVPARVHGPCLEAIGGNNPLTSSHGNPTALGECEWGDRTPPIEWQPAPGQTFPNSIISNQSGSIRAGGASLKLVLETTEGLRVPRDLTVECWNGQRWRPAYVVSGLGGNDPQLSEIESGVEPANSNSMVTVSESELSLPVPRAAPASDYRIVDTAQRCTREGACEEVAFTVDFRVTEP